MPMPPSSQERNRKRSCVPPEYLHTLYNLHKNRPTRDTVKSLDLIPYTLCGLVNISLSSLDEIKFIPVVFDGFGRLCVINDSGIRRKHLLTDSNNNIYNDIGNKNNIHTEMENNNKKSIKQRIKKSGPAGILSSKKVLNLPELQYTTHLPLFYDENKVNTLSFIFSQIHLVITQYLYEKKLTYLKLSTRFQIKELRPITTKEKKKSRFRILSVLFESIRIVLQIVEAAFDVRLCEESAEVTVQFVSNSLTHITTNKSDISKQERLTKMISNLSVNTQIYRHKYKIMRFLLNIKAINNNREDQKYSKYSKYIKTVLSLFRGLKPYLVSRLNSLVYRFVYGRNKSKNKLRKETKQRKNSKLDIRIKKELYNTLKSRYSTHNNKIFKQRVYKLFNEVYRWRRSGLPLCDFRSDFIVFKTESNKNKENKNREEIMEIIFESANRKYNILLKESEDFRKKQLKVYERNKYKYYSINIDINTNKSNKKNEEENKINQKAMKRVKYNTDIREYSTNNLEKAIKIPKHYKRTHTPKHLKLKFYTLTKNTKIHTNRLTRNFLINIKGKEHSLNYVELSNLVDCFNNIPNTPFTLFSSIDLFQDIDINYNINYKEIVETFSIYNSQYVKARRKFVKRFTLSEQDLDTFLTLNRNSKNNNELETVLNKYLKNPKHFSTEVKAHRNILNDILIMQHPKFKIPQFKKRRCAQVTSFLEDHGINLLVDLFFNEILLESISCIIPPCITSDADYIVNTLNNNNNKVVRVFEFEMDLPIFLLHSLLRNNTTDNTNNIVLHHIITRLDAQITYKNISHTPFYYNTSYNKIYAFHESLNIIIQCLLKDILSYYEIEVLYIQNNLIGIHLDTQASKSLDTKLLSIRNSIGTFLKLHEVSRNITSEYQICYNDIRRAYEIDRLEFSVIDSLVFKVSHLLSATLSITDLINRYNTIIVLFIKKYHTHLFSNKLGVLNILNTAIINKVMEIQNSRMYCRYGIGLFYCPAPLGLGLINLYFPSFNYLNRNKDCFYRHTDIKQFIKYSDKNRKVFIDMDAYNSNILKYLGGPDLLKKQCLSYLFDTNTINNSNKSKENKIKTTSQIRAIALLPNKQISFNWLPSLNIKNVFVGEKEYIFKYVWIIGKLNLRSSVKRMFLSNIKNNKQNLYFLLTECIKDTIESVLNSQGRVSNRFVSERHRPDFTVIISNKEYRILVAVTITDDAEELHRDFLLNNNDSNNIEHSLVHINVINKRIEIINSPVLIKHQEMISRNTFNSTSYNLILNNISEILNVPKPSRVSDIRRFFNNILMDSESELVWFVREGVLMERCVFDRLSATCESDIKQKGAVLFDTDSINKGTSNERYSLIQTIKQKEIIEAPFSLRCLKHLINKDHRSIYEVLIFYNTTLPGLLNNNNKADSSIIIDAEYKYRCFMLTSLFIQSMNYGIEIDHTFLYKTTYKIISTLCIDIKNQELSLSAILNIYKDINNNKSSIKEYNTLNLRNILKEFNSHLNHLASFLTERILNKYRKKHKVCRSLSDTEIRSVIFNINDIEPDIPLIDKSIIDKKTKRVYFNGSSNREFFLRNFGIQLREIAEYCLMSFKKDIWSVRDYQLLHRSGFLAVSTGIISTNIYNKYTVHLYEILFVINQENRGVFYISNNRSKMNNYRTEDTWGFILIDYSHGTNRDRDIDRIVKEIEGDLIKVASVCDGVVFFECQDSISYYV